MKKPKLKLFLDEGVPASVGSEFLDSGHHVIFLKDCIATGSPDDLVCVAAEQNEAILVACDGDMKQMVKRFGIGKGRFTKLSLIKLSVNSPLCASRTKQAMSLIEHEWNVADGKKARRLYVEIKSDVIRTLR